MYKGIKIHVYCERKQAIIFIEDARTLYYLHLNSKFMMIKRYVYSVVYCTLVTYIEREIFLAE